MAWMPRIIELETGVDNSRIKENWIYTNKWYMFNR
jgi:hypothetical protein